MKDMTKMGGFNSKFPQTMLTALQNSSSDDLAVRNRALDTLISAYWKPIYKYLRIKWNKRNDDAKDLTQAFFATAIEKEYFKSYDPEKARFRTFVRTCVDGFVMNDNKAKSRIKRGGQVEILPLDFDNAEKELSFANAHGTENPEEYFDQEWTRNLFQLATEELRKNYLSKNKEVHFKIFEIYDLENDGTSKISYESLAQQFSLPSSKVRNYLSFARRDFKNIVLEKLKNISETEKEFKEEVKFVFGIDI